MSVLLTGGTGFLGSSLIPRLLAKGHEVIALVRDFDKAKSLLPQEVKIAQGDVTELNLGIECEIPKIDKLYHLAAIHRLDESQSAQLWETNVLGTENVIRFCEKYGVPHLLFCSTAYVFGRNSYERSKSCCESMVMRSTIPHKTIFKPSIIMPTGKQAYFGHFIQVALLLVKVHQRAEVIRRYLEGKARLPILRPSFRIQGNPEGYLNLVSLDDVATAMADIEDEGVFWLTNPNPAKVKELVEWIGEVILLDLRVEPKFRPTPVEAVFQKVAAAFLPYGWGDSFTSDLKSSRATDKKFVQDALINSLLSRLIDI